MPLIAARQRTSRDFRVGPRLCENSKTRSATRMIFSGSISELNRLTVSAAKAVLKEKLFYLDQASSRFHPGWVMSRHLSSFAGRLLIPRKRRNSRHPRTAAWGQKLTSPLWPKRIWKDAERPLIALLDWCRATLWLIRFAVDKQINTVAMRLSYRVIRPWLTSTFDELIVYC